MTGLPVAVTPAQLASLAALAAIPEEEIWLASQKSARTRRAYRQDVAHFMRTLGIATPEQLRQVDHRAVIAWERIMREQEGAAASTVRRRLAALSSLFKHLVRYGTASRNPVADVQRPTINREEGSTAAFSKAQARLLLDAGGRHRGGAARPGDSVRGPAGRITAGGDRGADRGRPAPEPGRGRAAANPQGRAARRPGHQPAGGRPNRRLPRTRRPRQRPRGAAVPAKAGNPKAHDAAGRMDPDAIDRVLRKYAAVIGLGRGYSAPSMRATFITTALEN